ncbi:MAG: N-acyl-D-amino-acid deacylase family protein, partial [Bacteroidota bacterium]
ATIGRLDNSEAARVLDGKGLIVAPGFIDVHTHVEGSIRRLPTADNFLFNGVTSIVTGNCGGSETQLDSFFTQLRSTGISLNLGTLVGHNSVRASVMGSVQRDPTPREQAQMEALVERAMRVGAMGFSTGLIYIPGTYSKTPEVVGLARAAAKSGGVYASHIRDEETEVFEAIDEALHVGREAGMPVQISHFKVSSKLMWGATAQTIEKVEQARAEGLDVTVDQYPYTASSTNLGVLVPSWALAGGQAALNRHLADPATREKIVAEMDRDFRERHGFDRIDYAVVASCTWNRSLEGKSIARINAEKGRQETLQAEIETVIEMMQQGGAQMIYHKMHEADVERVLRFPYSMVASDSDIRSFGAGMPHPRGYGTNARVLGRYVREKKVIRLEEAIRKMTSLPAQRFRFEDRGLIRPSMWADIAVFDEQTVGDKATFEKPHAYSEGFRFVLVNGQIVIEDGKHTGARPGQVILGRGVSTLSNSTPE